MFDGEEILYGKLQGQESALHDQKGEEVLHHFAKNLNQSLRQDDVEPLRLKRANTVLAFVGISHFSPSLTKSLDQGITEARDAERSTSIRQKLDQALLKLKLGKSPS